MQYFLETDVDSLNDPTWDQVQSALNDMDSVRSSRVVLALEGVGLLTAAGGGNQRYIVIFMSDDDEKDTLTLVDNSLRGQQDIDLIVEGVLGRYPSERCVYKPLLLKVFQYFYENGSLPKDLSWRIENTDTPADLNEYF